MSGPSITLTPSFHAQLPIDASPAPTAPPSDAQIAQTAKDILGTGDRPIIADDYDARAVRFGQEMSALSPPDRARLLDEVMRQDPGALDSWLKLDIIDRMHGEGRMTQGEYGAIAEGFVHACNTPGGFGQEQAEAFLQVRALTDRAPALVDQQFQQMRSFLDAAGSGTEVQAFREQFAETLLSRGLGEQSAWAFHAPGLAMQIAADSGDPAMAARVFNDVLEANGGSEATRTRLLDAIGQSSIGFQNSLGGVDGLVNPLATLIDSVARQPGTGQWNDIAIAIARYADSAANEVFYDFYTDKPLPELSGALSNLLSGTHGTAVLDALTQWDTSAAPGGDGHAQRFGQNAIDLGNLLRLTAFNPDNPRADAAMATVEAWAGLRKDYLNGVEGQYPPGMSVSQAREQLGMLGGAAFDAVQQMKIDQDNRAAATQALVGFVVDLALSAVPGGGKVSGLIAGDLKSAFGNNPAIDRVIDQALSGGDTLPGQAIDQLKQDIARAVGEDQAALEGLRATVSNFMTGAVISGLSEGSQADGGQSHRDIVKTHVQNVQDDIQDNRR